MRQMLRRGAMLALVLILLLSHTMGVQAVGTEVAVNSYEELSIAVEQAEDMDTIIIASRIVIPVGSKLGDSSKRVIFDFTGGYLEYEQDYYFTTTSSLENISFSGARKSSVMPMLRVSGKVDIRNCEFKRANAGAVYTGNSSITFTDCTFTSNKGTYSAHLNIGNNATVILENCYLSYGVSTVRGGAIYLDYNTSYATLKNCIVTANESVYGGGIFNSGNLTLESTLLYNNHASTGGDDFCSTNEAYNLGSLEAMEQAFKDQNIAIKPLSWETSTDQNNGYEYYKLSYTASSSEPEEGGNTGGTEGGDPTNPEEGGETGGNEGGEPPDPDPSNPSEGGSDTGDEGGGSTNGEDNPTGGDTEGGNEGGSGDEQDPTTPPEDTEGGDPPTEGGSDAPDPSTPSNPEQGGSGGSTDNSQTDNSTTDNSDHSTTDNSSSTVTDNSDHSTTDNSESTSSSTVDNSSRVSNTDNSSVDNSSSRSESSRTENSNNTTTYNYYTAEDEGSQAAPVAPQGGSQPITVNVSVPQADRPQRAAQEPVEATGTQDQGVDQNIHIDAEGVDVIYEYTADGVSISISSNKGSESPTEAVEAMAVSSSTLPSETPTEAPRGSESWVDYATLILLAVLVLGELRDKFKKNA